MDFNTVKHITADGLHHTAWGTMSPAIVTQWHLHPLQPQNEEASSYCMRMMQWVLWWPCWTPTAFSTQLSQIRTADPKMGSCLCFCPEIIQWWDHSKIFIRTLGHCKKDDASNMSLNVAAGRCNCLLQYNRTQQQQMSPVFVVALISLLNSKILNIVESWSQSRCWRFITHKIFTLSSIAVRSKHSRHVLILQVSHQTLKWRFHHEQVLQDVYKSILPAGAGILNMGELDAARRWDMVSPNYPCCMLISAGVERPSGGKWSEFQNKRKAMKLVIKWGAAKWRHLLKPHSVRVSRTTSSGWRRSSPWQARGHQCMSDRDLSHFIKLSSGCA